jgi:DNA polymerase kappa
MPEDTAWKDYQSVFTAAKAGMEGVDKERVKKTVYEMSKVENAVL